PRYGLLLALDQLVRTDPPGPDVEGEVADAASRLVEDTDDPVPAEAPGSVAQFDQDVGVRRLPPARLLVDERHVAHEDAGPLDLVEDRGGDVRRPRHASGVAFETWIELQLLVAPHFFDGPA